MSCLLVFYMLASGYLSIEIIFISGSLNLMHGDIFLLLLLLWGGGVRSL
jgi:hypothetical protein